MSEVCKVGHGRIYGRIYGRHHLPQIQGFAAVAAASILQRRPSFPADKNAVSPSWRWRSTRPRWQLLSVYLIRITIPRVGEAR